MPEKPEPEGLCHRCKNGMCVRVLLRGDDVTDHVFCNPKGMGFIHFLAGRTVVECTAFKEDK